MILNSKEDLSPPRYEFGPLAMPADSGAWHHQVRLISRRFGLLQFSRAICLYDGRVFPSSLR